MFHICDCTYRRFISESYNFCKKGLTQNVNFEKLLMDYHRASINEQHSVHKKLTLTPTSLSLHTMIAS